MDCLSFRRRLLVDPQHRDAAMDAHSAACEQCQNFLGAAMRFERQLDRTAKVTVADDLSARILMRISNPSRTNKYWSMGAVAGIAILITIAVWFTAYPSAQRQVASYLSAHGYTTQSNAPTAAADAATILRKLGVRASDTIGPVASAMPCVVGQKAAVHLVLESDHGPVTVLVLPFTEVAKTARFKVGDQVPLIAPCPRGSIAVAGTPQAAVDAARARVERAISFI